MSAVFVPAPQRAGKPAVTPETIQKMLDENSHLIKCIVEHQQKGRIQECSEYQRILHRNLVWLATVADSNQNGSQSMLSTTPPAQNVSKPHPMPPTSHPTNASTPQPPQQQVAPTTAPLTQQPPEMYTAPHVPSYSVADPQQPPLQQPAHMQNPPLSQPMYQQQQQAYPTTTPYAPNPNMNQPPPHSVPSTQAMPPAPPQQALPPQYPNQQMPPQPTGYQLNMVQQNQMPMSGAPYSQAQEMPVEQQQQNTQYMPQASVPQQQPPQYNVSQAAPQPTHNPAYQYNQPPTSQAHGAWNNVPPQNNQEYMNYQQQGNYQ